MTNPPKNIGIFAQLTISLRIAQDESREPLSPIFVPVNRVVLHQLRPYFLSGIHQLTLSQWNVSRVRFQVPSGCIFSLWPMWKVTFEKWIKILSLDCDSNRVRIFSDCLRERLGISAHKRPVKECGLTQLTARCQTFRGWICWRYLIEPAWNDVHQVVAKQDARTIPCFVGEATISSTSSKWSASSLYTWGWWMTFLPSHFEETHAMGCFALCIHLISHRPLLDETSGFSWYLHQPHWPTSTEYSLLSSAAHHEFLTEQFLCSSLLSRSHDSHIYTF